MVLVEEAKLALSAGECAAMPLAFLETGLVAAATRAAPTARLAGGPDDLLSVPLGLTRLAGAMF